MATESSGFDEAMDVGTSTISHLKALKTASTITKAGFGAAGGPFTAAIGIAIANPAWNCKNHHCYHCHIAASGSFYSHASGTHLRKSHGRYRRFKQQYHYQ